MLDSILSFSKEAGEDFSQGQATKPRIPPRRFTVPENVNIIDEVLANLEDISLVLRFIKRENLTDLFNRNPMLGVEFTRIYESTKNRLESNGIINTSRADGRIDIDSSIQSIKSLSILTQAILNDKKIQIILERNTNIFTIVTEYLFGISQTPS